MDSLSDSWLSKIHEELALPHPSASRLAEYVREVASCQPPERLSVPEQQDLSKAAQAALDPPLLALLERRKMLDIAITLVCNYITDRDSVAEAVCCPPSTIEGESWFEQFCQKYPQACALQNAPWVEVQKYMQPTTDGGSTSTSTSYQQLTEDHTSQYEDAVLEIWSQKNSLRTSIIKHRLPPSVAQKLEGEGLTTVEDLDETKVDSLISEKGISNANKSRIRQLYQQESSEGKRKQEFKVKSIQQQTVNAEEAVRLTDELILAVQKQQDAEAKTTAARLNEVMSKLKVSSWKWSDEQLRKPIDLISHLKKVQLELIGASQYLKVVVPGTYHTDEEIIARTSAGLALYGFSFGGSSDSDRLGMKPSCPVLLQPVFCPLKSPAYGNKIISMSFSSMEAASCYRNTVISSGNSFASGWKASGWGFNTNGHVNFTLAGENETKSAKRSQGSLAATIMYALVPMKSFRIPKAQMKLSVDAEQEARAITNSQKAQIFLDTFGSHVSDGIHHLGGIFWETVELKSGESNEESERHEVASNNSDVGVAGGYGGFFNVTAGVQNVASASTGTGEGKEQIHRKHETRTRIETDGPNVTDYGLFTELLASNNQSWFIIDRAGSESLISIWELLKEYREAQMDKAAALIRSVWLERANQFASVEGIQREIHRTGIDQFASEASLNLPHLGIEEIRIVEELNLLCGEDLSQFSKDDLASRVASVFKSIFDHGHRYGHDLFITLMRGELHSFLVQLAKLKDQNTVQSVFHLLNLIFDGETLSRLNNSDPPIKLPQQLISAMKKAKSMGTVIDTIEGRMQVLQVPDMDVHDVVQYMEEKAKTSPEISMQSHVELLNQVVARVFKRLVRRKLPSQTQKLRDQMLGVVARYGWTEDGLLNPLTLEGVEYLIQEVKNVISPEVEDDLGVESLTSHPDGPQEVFASTNHFPYAYREWLIDRSDPLGGKSLSSHADTLEETFEKDVAYEDQAKHLIYLLKHRLAFPTGARLPAKRQTRKTRLMRNFEQDTQALPPREQTSGSYRNIFPLHQISQRLAAQMEITARAELFRLLLERRFLVPFISSAILHEGVSERFHCDSTALSLVQTVIGEDKKKEQVVDSLATNQSCLRIAVISERVVGQQATQHWIKELLKVNSLFCVDWENGFTGASFSSQEPMAELGWGFLDPNTTVMVLHVVGGYLPLKQFILAFAEVILVDIGPETCTHPSRARSSLDPVNITTIEWISADPDLDDEEDPEQNIITFRSSEASSVAKIRAELFDILAARTTPPAERLSGQKYRIPSLIHTDHMTQFDVDSLVMGVDVTEVRRDIFNQQQTFQEEGRNLTALHREKDAGRRHVLQQTIEKVRKQRKSYGPAVESHVLIQWFLGLLQQPDMSTHAISIRQLEQALSQRSSEVLAPLKKQVRDAKFAWHTSRMEEDKKNWGCAVEELNSSNLNIEHLWRELSHLYVANPRFAHYPALAAQHLIDGFSLEMMDGDAAMMNVEWIKAVLAALQRALDKKCDSSSSTSKSQNCHLLVLSVIGPQSSGKSTLLNVMFGIRLRTSVSQTTRGVNIQLLPCENRTFYDFVLLMDTEGLRAPENIGLDDMVWRDNRMATFAILPADATIVLTLGESTNDLNKILPVVLSAYLESELAHKTGGYLPPKMLFVFNQINLSQANKMENIIDTFLHQLEENASVVEQTRVGTGVPQQEVVTVS